MAGSFFSSSYASRVTFVPLDGSVPTFSSPTRGRSTPNTFRTYTAPMCAKPCRCSGRTPVWAAPSTTNQHAPDMKKAGRHRRAGVSGADERVGFSRAHEPCRGNDRRIPFFSHRSHRVVVHAHHARGVDYLHLLGQRPAAQRLGDGVLVAHQ